ncbi:alpha-xenorhabdolysin family binary toxin subunit A [Elioraea sp.]|uniref:alpha-xenorhabdolysin family binary toxin subunit A n=1 Tax=Elioraea sp. TaxID=2185103 RepID=UPI0025B8E132|nr:alpha-xenorhabdolysin family binary toxin subunit A [Elioraea sp.]
MAVPVVYRKPAGALGAILPQAPIENLVFEGGGPKGLVYLGAVQVLEQRGMTERVRNVGGASAGAMTALAVGLGFTSAEVRGIVEKQSIGDLTDLGDGDHLTLPAKAIEALKNLFGTSGTRGRGLYRGEKLLAWIQAMVARRVAEAGPVLAGRGADAVSFWNALQQKKGAITFAELARLAVLAPELHIRHLAFTGTNFTDQCIEVFSAVDTPDMPIALAVRISASLPWFFRSVKYQGKEYIDGGLLENFPMWIFDAEAYRAPGHRKILRGVFDQNLATLGFKVDSTEEIRRILWEGAQQDTTSGLAKVWADVKAKLTKLQNGVDSAPAWEAADKAVYGKYAQRTIQIPDLGYSTFNFDLDDADKAKLRKSGEDATTEWFSLYYDGAGIELEIHGPSELADYLSPEAFAATCAAYPGFADPKATGGTVMADDPTPFDPKKNLYDGISILSTDDWIEMTTFFDTAVSANPSTEALMRKTLGMDAKDEFRPEFGEAVGLYLDLKGCGEKFKADVQDKMLLLADDIVQYNDAASSTYERLVDLVDRFDFDGVSAVTTADQKWLKLAETWASGTTQGRSDQIKQRFQSALDGLIKEATERAEKADALQKAILAPDGILARLNTSKAAFKAAHTRFETAFGKEGAETTKLRTMLASLQEDLKSLQKKEKDEIIVLGTSPIYIYIPFIGPLIFLGVDIGVGIDLALTRAKIQGKLDDIQAYTGKIGLHERFSAYYTTAKKGVDGVADQIEKVAPKVETLGKAWRAIASDLANVRKVLSTDGNVSIKGGNWFNLVIALTNAKKGWARIADQADHFRRFGGTPKKCGTVAEFVAAVDKKAA